MARKLKTKTKRKAVAAETPQLPKQLFVTRLEPDDTCDEELDDASIYLANEAFDGCSDGDVVGVYVLKEVKVVRKVARLEDR